jgi:hypothetical protein
MQGEETDQGWWDSLGQKQCPDEGPRLRGVHERVPLIGCHHMSGKRRGSLAYSITESFKMF